MTQRHRDSFTAALWFRNMVIHFPLQFLNQSYDDTFTFAILIRGMMIQLPPQSESKAWLYISLCCLNQRQDDIFTCVVWFRWYIDLRSLNQKHDGICLLWSLNQRHGDTFTSAVRLRGTVIHLRLQSESGAWWYIYLCSLNQRHGDTFTSIVWISGTVIHLPL